MIDENFLGRVYKSSIYWSLLVLSYLLLAKMTPSAVGFGIGVALGVGTLRSIERVVRVIYVPNAVQAAKIKMGVFGIVKYFILAIIIGMIVRAQWISIPAFACGIGVPTAIIFLKTISHFFSELEFHPFWGGELEPKRAGRRYQ